MPWRESRMQQLALALLPWTSVALSAPSASCSDRSRVATAKAIGTMPFAIKLSRQWLSSSNGDKPVPWGTYACEHGGVRCELRVEQSHNQLTLFPLGETHRSRAIGLFCVRHSNDVMSIPLALWYRRGGNGVRLANDYKWLKPLRASALALWLWQLTHGDVPPRRIVHEDVTNPQTLRKLHEVGASADSTFDLRSMSATGLLRDPVVYAENGDAGAAVSYLQGCPNGKMACFISAELGATLSRLVVAYPIQHGGIGYGQPKVVLELECSDQS
jgi:hypothetical protein